MNTKIRVEYDFYKKEPFIQFVLDVLPNQSVEMLDQMLRHFVKQTNNKPLVIQYPIPNNCPELRVVTDLKDKSQQGHLAGIFGNWSHDVIFNGHVRWTNPEKITQMYSDFMNAIYDGLDLSELKGISEEKCDKIKAIINE